MALIFDLTGMVNCRIHEYGKKKHLNMHINDLQVSQQTGMYTDYSVSLKSTNY